MPRSRSRSPDLENRTATGAVLDFMTAHKGTVIAARTVADSLGLDRKVTATLLSRLAHEGILVKLDRGRYSSSRNTRPSSNPKTVRARRVLLSGGEDLWKRAFDGISAEIDRALGPATTGRLGTGGPPQAHRERTELLIAALRQELGGRLALDLVQPVLESIFGTNGRAAAVRLCIPRGGAGE
jgi:hypothetical protein